MRDEKRERWKRAIGMWLAIIALFLLIGFFLWQFNVDMRQAERMRNRDKMMDMADKAMLAAENRLTGAINILETAAGRVSPSKAVKDSEMIEYLNMLAENNKMDRIGVVDMQGNVTTTNGNTANAAQEEFFQRSIEGEWFISSVLLSQKPDEKCIGVSVPIKNLQNQIEGVLYGVILVKDMDLYTDFKLEKNEGTLVHIVDEEGNYIAKGKRGNYEGFSMG